MLTFQEFKLVAQRISDIESKSVKTPQDEAVLASLQAKQHQILSTGRPVNPAGPAAPPPPPGSQAPSHHPSQHTPPAHTVTLSSSVSQLVGPPPPLQAPPSISTMSIRTQLLPALTSSTAPPTHPAPGLHTSSVRPILQTTSNLVPSAGLQPHPPVGLKPQLPAGLQPQLPAGLQPPPLTGLQPHPPAAIRSMGLSASSKPSLLTRPGLQPPGQSLGNPPTTLQQTLLANNPTLIQVRSYVQFSF